MRECPSCHQHKPFRDFGASGDRAAMCLDCQGVAAGRGQAPAPSPGRRRGRRPTVVKPAGLGYHADRLDHLMADEYATALPIRTRGGNR